MSITTNLTRSLTMMHTRLPARIDGSLDAFARSKFFSTLDLTSTGKYSWMQTPENSLWQ